MKVTTRPGVEVVGPRGSGSPELRALRPLCQNELGSGTGGRVVACSRPSWCAKIVRRDKSDFFGTALVGEHRLAMLAHRLGVGVEVRGQCVYLSGRDALIFGMRRKPCALTAYDLEGVRARGPARRDGGQDSACASDLVVDLARRIARAGLWHGDFKPGNILCASSDPARNGAVWATDWDPCFACRLSQLALPKRWSPKRRAAAAEAAMRAIYACAQIFEPVEDCPVAQFSDLGAWRDAVGAFFRVPASARDFLVPREEWSQPFYLLYFYFSSTSDSPRHVRDASFPRDRGLIRDVVADAVHLLTVGRRAASRHEGTVALMLQERGSFSIEELAERLRGASPAAALSRAQDAVRRLLARERLELSGGRYRAPAAAE